MSLLGATDRDVVVDETRGTSVPAQGLTDRPTCIAVDPLAYGRAWCGTHRSGVFRTAMEVRWHDGKAEIITPAP